MLSVLRCPHRRWSGPARWRENRRRGRSRRRSPSPQARHRQHGRPAAIHDVGDQRLLDAPGDLGHLGLGLGRFDEDDVGARPRHRPRRGRSPPRGPCDVRASVRAMIRKSALERRVRRDRILRTMSSSGTTRRLGVWPHFLGNSWSSIWIAGHPGLLVAPHRVAHVEQPAIAGIGIRDDGRLRHLRDAADALDHLAIGRDAGIRQPKRRPPCRSR